ncbi:MAG: iron-containing alcohol dehydrogenase [Archaeoglobus sp.]|nr:iron-containing alcohol dehydrogenase [Archaeoglobus sp.]
MWWFASPRIAFGEDALEFLESLEGKFFVVTDSNLVKSGVVEKAVKHLRGEIEIFDGVEPDPSFEIVEEAVAVARTFQPDYVVGIGGGSSLDVAKGVRIIYENPHLNPEEISPWTDVEEKGVKLILIPTASGSGSEASNAIVLTKKDEDRKIASVHPRIMADYAIVDPEMVKDLPERVAVFTGLDALSHAIDAYVSAWKNDFTDGICIQACKLLFTYLPRACKDRSDREAVERVHNAATLAGLAIGSSQAGLSHSLGHSIGGVLHIPHGFACGICLPYTTKYYSRFALEYYEELAYHLGIQAKKEEAVDELVKKIKTLLADLNVPDNLKGIFKEYGIGEEEFYDNLKRLVYNASTDNTVLTLADIPSEEDFEKLFIHAFEGKDVDF